MPELRYNVITGEWVILATERAQRPLDHLASEPLREEPEYVASCPFCRGNESETAAEIARVPRAGPWTVRAVQNRFPALSPEGEPAHVGDGYTRSISGVGRHEVVIESPLHNQNTATLPLAHVEAILDIYRDRMRAFYADPKVEHVIVFKNHGITAGSSLDHPHSQVVGTPVVPGQLRMRIEEALRHYGDHSECLFCYCLRQELASEARLVEQNESFVAFIPYAALSPFHIWIFPRRHAAYFGDLGDRELSALAEILSRTLRRVFVGLRNPHFNYVVRSLSPSERDVKYYHWYLSIIVRVSRMAGFELGTGMFINTAFPEDSARFLRQVLSPDPIAPAPPATLSNDNACSRGNAARDLRGAGHRTADGHATAPVTRARRLSRRQKR